MYQGSCLCGGITFEITGPIEDIVYCHCSECRRVQGSAFATNGNVRKEDFEFTRGENLLSTYETSPGKTKFFCSKCGSPMLSTNQGNPDYVRVRIGTIQSDIKERPSRHLFVGSKANWDEIHDSIPQHQEF